ncbi:hypothetical protein ARMGADRAFT_1078781 [Armillaria gallica]|uniref:Uncharacterized protein n=1 Tax=Armillaria gallica TaxID=47427 RepID=A0A2H3DI74_ARMGA|nr:hypothetical protein ARMGADRAFT_1078781 [Armillaria gallica]
MCCLAGTFFFSLLPPHCAPLFIPLLTYLRVLASFQVWKDDPRSLSSPGHQHSTTFKLHFFEIEAPWRAQLHLLMDENNSILSVFN